MIEQIQTENNLIYIAHNIKRIFNKIKKQTQQILQKNTKPCNNLKFKKNLQQFI
jgi:hypothetical protein